MAEVIFDGKKYKEIDLESEKAFESIGIYTFRYFPKDDLWIASESMCKDFQMQKTYKGTPWELTKDLVYEGDIDIIRGMQEEILRGAKSVTKQLRSADYEFYRVSFVVASEDAEGNPDIVVGIIENYDDESRQSGLIQMLSDEYYSVFYVDFENDVIIPYRMLGIINERYGGGIKNNLGYDTMISKYIDGEVIEEERAEMHTLTSYENLAKELSDKKTYRHDFTIIREGKPVFIRMKAANISDGKKLTKIVLGFADVTNERKEQWARMAYIDHITEGYNYTYFAERLKHAEKDGYVISMDIHTFKIVNSVCGFTMGDTVLSMASHIIEDCIPKSGFSGHVNADHFVFYVESEKEQEIVSIIDKVTQKFNDMVIQMEIPKVHPYFGISKWTVGKRVQVAFSEANTAKHRIKDYKEVNYGFYRDEDTRKAIEERAIEDAFESAKNNGEFEIWYQPKYSPKDGSLTGAEALVRWRRQDGNIVPPGKFIPIYERDGLIRQLDEYVFTKVCEQQRRWKDMYNKNVPISINLSRASLYYDGIVEDYKDIAVKTKVEPMLVPIEITESAAIDNSDIRNLAVKFNEAGFPLHIDDFGSGYSSLSTLNMMKFDTLKLDKSLIDYIGGFGGDRLIKHTIALAKDLGLSVTAEGVECKEQVDFLKEVDCDSIQGYYYSKVITAHEFEEQLKLA